MKEAELQDALVDAAHLGGWMVAHFAPARTAHGWRTPGRYDAQGFPDLVLARPGDSVLFWELKSQRGKPSDHQERWLEVLGQTTGTESGLIRPTNLEVAALRLIQGKG